MDLSMYLNNRIMALLPSELDRLFAKAQAAPSSDQLQANFEAHEAKLLAAYGDSDKPRLRNGSIGDNGVAVIYIKGVLFNVESYWDEIYAYYFGGTSYQSLMRDIDTVMNDSEIQAVGFHVHSPGGEAFGMNETSNKISALTAKKTTIGYAYGYAASAGYGLIAATGEIHADANAWVGSIGTVMRWADFTGMYEKLGIAYEEVTSTNAPYKRLDIRIPEERAVFMQEIDGVEEVFIKKVAKDRKFTVEKVKSDFGKGAVMAGKAAKAAGMIDQVGSWDDVLKQLQTKAKKTNKTSANTSAKGDLDMGFKESFKAFAVEHGLIVADKNENAPDASNENSGANNSTAAPQSAAEIQAANQRATTAEKQLADFKAEREQEKQTQLKTEAENFVKTEISAGRMVPAEKELFQSLYLQAAADDATNPLAEGSRIDNLKTIQSKRKSHGFTSEMLAPDSGAQILAGDDSPAAQITRDAEAQADAYDKQMGGGKPKLEAVK